MSSPTCFLYAPAGRFEDEPLKQAVTNLKKYFSDVSYDPINSAGYFSGNIDERAEQFRLTLKKAENSETVPWIMAVRGGYGSIEVAERFRNYKFIRPTVFSGFSDISVFLNLFADDKNFIPVYGMNALHSFTGKIDTLSFSYQLKLIEDFAGYQYGPEVLSELKSLNDWRGEIRGEFGGGCLAVLLSTLGTPFFPDLRDKILFLEDVNEPIYAIDRMLKQLEMAGVFDKIKGLVVGEFYQCEAQNGINYIDVFKKYFGRREYPVVYNFPMGHGERHIPLKFSTALTLSVKGENAVSIHYGERLS
jgi:muramoyltetrapeptide carboxypeptidase